ncbi:MAG: polysaccharide biosynthesis tyrosine autokinase [Trichormus sp. ATA11-4-KO1]|jgi:capsular exopolysaccharide synthesis family protein|nr:polysaccharide biosynthesis tyrosine autokinase [Trichormus sp. ATA11-4-KO1]
MELPKEHTINLDTYLQVLQRRWMSAIGIFFPVFLILLLPLMLRKSIYIAEGKLLFQKTNTISNITGLGTEVNKLESVNSGQSNPLNTQAEIIRSVPIVQNTINKLNLKDDKGMPMKLSAFLKNLTVAEIDQTDILLVKYQDTNPQLAAQVVNTLMAIYLEYNVYTHRFEAVSARKFIEQQLPNAELVVRQAEAELAGFKEKNKIVSLQEEAIKAVEVITDLEKQISTTQSQIANVNAQSQEIRKQLGMNSQQAVMMTSLSQIPGVQNLLTEIQQLESQLIDRRTVLQDAHPQIIDLEDKLNSLKLLLQQRIKQVTGTNTPQPINHNFQLGVLQQQISAQLAELESTQLGLERQAAALSSSQANYQQRLNNMPKLEQQQRQLERKVQAAQSTYTILLQKLQESRITEYQNVNNASMISQAQVPEEPINISFMILSAALLAIITTLGAILLLETRDKSIKTVDEAKELLGLTVLGMIPSFSKPKKLFRSQKEPELHNKSLLVRNAPQSPISEAYRMLRSNLRLMSTDQELKVTVITSSVPSEGKSTVAANLAVVIAQMERKVLLIDGDLHSPAQHKIWELTNNQGLTNLIVEQSAINIGIKKVMHNLDVLTSGIIPPNPASLLDSKRMAALIKKFAANYDFAIIDAPALNVAADAATLGQMADGVLLVVRPGVVDSVNATFAKEFLEKSGQNILGQIVNGVIPQNEPHNCYYISNLAKARQKFPDSVRSHQAVENTGVA